MKRVFAILLVLGTAVAGPMRAQVSDEDEAGGLLVRFLEGTFSDESRQIEVSGLEGAFSSQASIKKLTVSDADGVWLTISGAVLDWNRLDLVRGKFTVNALTAEEIVIARKPLPSTAVDLPNPEAQPFALPELPVAVELGEIGVKRFELGEPVLGLAAELRMSGALSLADGALETELSVTRLDRPGDALDLMAQFSNTTRQIALDLKLIEDAGGLISTVLKMPDRPPLLFTAKGDGPISDFTADIALVSDDAERIGGAVRLRGLEVPEGTDPTAPQGTRFSADLAGDITPMLPPEYRAFFGAETRLALNGVNHPDGRMEIEQLDLSSDALLLNGKMAMAAGGKLETALLHGRIAPPSGETVLLPISGPQTRIGAAQITLRMDGSETQDWDLTLSTDRLSRPDLTLRRADLSASGTMDQSAGLALDGDITAGLRGLEFTDTALAQAVGKDVTLDGHFTLPGTGALAFQGIELTGTDYTATLDGSLDGLQSGFEMEGRLRLEAADLGRFSGLAGRDLGGAVSADLSGTGAPLAGSFDITLAMQAQDLSAGIEQLDPLIAGTSTLALEAARGTDGLNIRSFTLDGTALSAQAKGVLKSTGSSLRFSAALDDLKRITPEVSGPLTLTGDLDQTGPAGREWTGKITLKGPDKSYADLSSTFDPDGQADLTFDALLDRIQRFVPDLPGQLAAKGKASRDTAGLWTLAADATGPAGVTTRIAGGFDETAGTADLTARGDLRLEAANPFMAPNSIAGRAEFDLALNGPPALSSLSGTVSTSGTRMAIPAAAQTIENISGRVTLGNSSAALAITGALGAGGGFRVSGPVALIPPYDGRIAVDLQNLILTDNKSVTSSASGQLLLSGPLTAGPTLSGRVVFGETELNLNAVSGSAAAAPIPQIAHVNEPAAVRATRARAGLIETGNGGGGGGPAIGLDLTLVALNRVFARGFGLQAELGGTLYLRGTTAAVEPVGQIELIRGTIDIIGRRLKLTKGVVTMQGDLSPYVDFSSSTTTEDGKATIEIAGPMDGPKVSVYAEPERPAEEALAMVVFGSRVADLSPFVIAKMAASLATLGRSGGAKDKLRKATGVDTVDFGTDDSGAAQVGAGTYLSDNIYTDFNINTQGETELNLNLDLSKSLTVKGSVDNSGSTGIGLFYERDY
ncbi:translocation/assembly module TamB domain-containing protein [Antarcticimicrobium sediminis]|uniref:Translocation/assembly module TamB n=1 Tax=Antarcticimicrobium sediminis TaxID=2546227 RepID=A0A4R5EMI9_9RHOB|nr:translocation/assembly module TamB domain-containing protein [Antarcticimicrobium sediminis]TDE35593.1 translocation/assembly module TamB [Antarcticimicrobium sediminis]